MDGHIAATEIIELPNGDSVDARFVCEACKQPYIPRSKRQTRTCGATKCRDRVLYLDGRKSLHNILSDAERNLRWREQNNGYWLAHTSLRKRGLITPERLAALQVLKGQGRLSTTEALERAGLGHLIADGKRKPPPPFELATGAPNPIVWGIGSPSLSRPFMHAAEIRLIQRGVCRSSSIGFADAIKFHGAIHNALGKSHDYIARDWTLVLPSPADRRLWMIAPHAEFFEQLPPSVTLYAPPESLNEFRPRARAFWEPAPHELRVGMRAAIRPPVTREPGMYRVRVNLLTPLVLRKSVTKAMRLADEVVREIVEDPKSLAGSLEHVAMWLGLQTPNAAIHAAVTGFDVERVLDADDEDGVIVGGHWRDGERTGRIAGLLGWIDLECNAVARWLLDCAVRTGIGARTTLGFGRIEVIDL